MQGGGEASVGEPRPPGPSPEEPPSERAASRREDSQEENVVSISDKKAPAPKPITKPRRPRIERFAMTAEEKSGLTQLVNELSLRLDASIKPSNLHRALHVLLRHSKDEILRRATQRAGHLARPGNDNHVGMAEFEHELARIIALGLKDAPPLREA
ncbi:MAG: hypothetical protein ABIH26_08345 [Candidatus Eisenbacteria bacterium]